ncbi:hypothetical protein D0839_02765 [Bordetella avium]|nr:hypothetical protein D0839_02765 [Bordetella avium]
MRSGSLHHGFPGKAAKRGLNADSCLLGLSAAAWLLNQAAVSLSGVFPGQKHEKSAASKLHHQPAMLGLACLAGQLPDVGVAA